MKSILPINAEIFLDNTGME